MNTTERLTATLRSHLWSDHPGRTCACGWKAVARMDGDPLTPSRVDQWLAHVVARITAEVLPAVVEDALAPIHALADRWDSYGAGFVAGFYSDHLRRVLREGRDRS